MNPRRILSLKNKKKCDLMVKKNRIEHGHGNDTNNNNNCTICMLKYIHNMFQTTSQGPMMIFPGL